MKIMNFWVVAIMALSFSLASTSCDDDDNKTTEEPNLAKLIAGTYDGYTKAVAQYFPNGMFEDDVTLTVTANENQTVKVTHTSAKFGTFTIDDATVTFTDNVYTITGTGKTVMGMEGSSPKEYDCELNATIDKDKETPSFVFTVPTVMGGTTITFSPGNAPTTAE